MSLELRDISVWQGAFNFNLGVEGVIAKATEGLGYTDPQWGRNQSILLAPGPLVPGSYHFGRPDLGNSVIAEADWYLGRHDPRCFAPGTPWIFSLDAESAGGSAVWCYAFMDHVSARIGYDCWFYSYASWISSRGVKAFNRPLWIAWPNAGAPPNLGWPAITMHQYGAVNGVDANHFLGDRSALLKLAGIGSAPPVPPTGEEFMHRVVKGDQKPACWKLEGNTKQWIRIVPQLQHLIATSATKTLEVWPQYVVDRIPRLEDVPEDLTGTGLNNYEDTAFHFVITRGAQLEPAGAPAAADLPAPLTVDKFPY